MVLTGEQQFEIRATRALQSGDASFKPRGQANKALFDKMKAEFAGVKQHTTQEADRIIEETTANPMDATP